MTVFVLLNTSTLSVRVSRMPFSILHQLRLMKLELTSAGYIENTWWNPDNYRDELTNESKQKELLNACATATA